MAGGQWTGWTLRDDDSLKYFQDAYMYRPIGEMLLGQEHVIVYECSLGGDRSA